MDPAYRADKRTLDEVKKAGGYKAWYPIPIEVARDLLQFVAGIKSWNECTFKPLAEKWRFDFPPSPLKGFGGTKSATPTCNPEALHEWVIRSGDRGPSISTATTEDCGGKIGNILLIDCADLAEVAWNTAIPGANVKVTARTPLLLLNAPLLADATAIALQAKTAAEERTFLTAIEASRLSLHKAA